MKKSPELATKVFEVLKDKKYEVSDAGGGLDAWNDLLNKHKIEYVKTFFNNDNDNELFQILNSPKNQFVYVTDPVNREGGYILKIPLQIATKIAVLGTLP